MQSVAFPLRTRESCLVPNINSLIQEEQLVNYWQKNGH